MLDVICAVYSHHEADLIPPIYEFLDDFDELVELKHSEVHT